MTAAPRPPIAAALVRASDPLDRWLWCLCCERFFQVRHLRYDAYKIERCAFADCIGAGLDRDIYLWSDWRGAGWPEHTGALRLGMRSPAAASLRQAQVRGETAALIAGFARSPELAELELDQPRWSEELVEKLSWWGVHPADVDTEYLAGTLRELAYWVACRATSARAVVAEVAALFCYGARAHGWPHARACALLLTDAAVIAELERCIREHRRRGRRRRS